MAKLIVPDFASEAEEAQWWFDNQNALDDEFLLPRRKAVWGTEPSRGAWACQPR